MGRGALGVLKLTLSVMFATTALLSCCEGGSLQTQAVVMRVYVCMELNEMMMVAGQEKMAQAHQAHLPEFRSW